MTKRGSRNLQGWIKTPPETHPSGFNFRNINKILKAFLKHSWGLFSRNTWMPLASSLLSNTIYPTQWPDLGHKPWQGRPQESRHLPGCWWTRPFLMKCWNSLVLMIPCNVQYLTTRFVFPSLNLDKKPTMEKDGFGEAATFSMTCYCSFWPGCFFRHFPLASRHWIH